MTARTSWAQVVALAARLSERDQEIVKSLDKVRLLTGAQLERLIFSHHPPHSRNHIRRRVLNHLSRLHLIATLERRIGGVRAGSDGLIYCLDRLGQRMADFLNRSTPTARTRTPRTPGVAFLNHTLAVSEAYTSLVEYSRHCSARVRTFLTEPVCRWPDGSGGTLRPDALVTVEDDTYLATTWLEVDQGTEQLGRIRDKVAVYDRFGRSGKDGPDSLLPRVLFAATNDKRTEEIQREIGRQGPHSIVCEVVKQSRVAEHVFAQLRT